MFRSSWTPRQFQDPSKWTNRTTRQQQCNSRSGVSCFGCCSGRDTSQTATSIVGGTWKDLRESLEMLPVSPKGASEDNSRTSGWVFQMGNLYLRLHQDPSKVTKHCLVAQHLPPGVKSQCQSDYKPQQSSASPLIRSGSTLFQLQHLKWLWTRVQSR